MTFFCAEQINQGHFLLSQKVGRKEMFYLTKHSTHFIYGYMDGRKYFIYDTFYLRLYGVRYMVKDHSDNERGNPLLPHGLLFTIGSNGYFIGIIPQTGWHIPRPLLHQSWSTGWNCYLRNEQITPPPPFSIISFIIYP